MEKKKVFPLRVVPGLAVSNLVHEWILSLCLVIAVAAVVAPLVVLLGLKYGTIETLRDRLVKDPVYREVRPAQIHDFEAKWLEEVGSWPEVQFLVPSVLPLSSIVHAKRPGTNRLEMLDLFSTAPGDPLLLENGVPPPQPGECVLTAEAARILALQAGDFLQAKVTRNRAGQRETAGSRLLISGVLPLRAGALPRIYCRLDFVLDVEAYKQGYAVPKRGWAGDRPEPFLSFDGAVLFISQELDPIARSGLIINTGLARIKRLDPGEVQETVGITGPKTWSAYQVISPGTVVTLSSLQALGRKLRGREHILLPYVKDLTLNQDTGRKLRPIGLSLSDTEASLLGLPSLPWGSFTGQAGPGSRLLQALVPDAPLDDRRVTFQGNLEMEFDLAAEGQSGLERIIVPAELLGVLRTGLHRDVVFDARSREFALVQGGFRGFRLYTKSIDSVPGVAQRLQDQGIEVIAQVESIQRIQVLDAGLGRLYGLLAGLGICGGAAVLLSSLYAAVERLRRDLGILRLVGLGRRHVFFLPLIQGQLIAAAGLALGFAASFSLARIINHTFASELVPGEKFCTLPPGYVIGIVILTLVLALVSSLAAAWRATRIDPAEVLRES
ncbi:MAG: ABC transporter permease [Thermodesulfobacteriota bacterium]